MSGNLSEKGRLSAMEKAEKRAAALRENLKRRKAAASGSAAVATPAAERAKDKSDADPQDRQ